MTFGESVDFYRENEPRGEYVLVIEGKSKQEAIEEKQQAFSEMTLEEHMKIYTDQGLSEKDAMKAVAKDRGVTKRDIYSELKTKNK